MRADVRRDKTKKTRGPRMVLCMSTKTNTVFARTHGAPGILCILCVAKDTTALALPRQRQRGDREHEQRRLCHHCRLGQCRCQCRFVQHAIPFHETRCAAACTKGKRSVCRTYTLPPPSLHACTALVSVDFVPVSGCARGQTRSHVTFGRSIDCRTFISRIIQQHGVRPDVEGERHQDHDQDGIEYHMRVPDIARGQGRVSGRPPTAARNTLPPPIL